MKINKEKRNNYSNKLLDDHRKLPYQDNNDLPIIYNKRLL